MSLPSKEKIFVGSFIHTNQYGELIIVVHGMIHVKNFIDCHIHAVQLPNLGVGYDKKLLEWLERYTFPLEKKYADDKFSEQVFNTVVKQTVVKGTTTACYFASLYSKASVLLGQAAINIGQRAFIGKVSMNMKRNDDYYETTDESIKNINKFIETLNNLNSHLIKPIITPRFALSCDMTLMKELGKLAKNKNLHIQTHISENLDEIEAVRNKFPEYSSYAAVYDAAGILTNKVLLAHGIYLSDNEIALINERGAAIVHCPSSNTCLKSGLCDIQRLKSKGVKIGLGTDVSGGQSCSILDTMKAALQVSVHLSLIRDNYEALNYKDVFHMATLGGAAALAMDNQIGNFEVGKEFDALVVDIDVSDGILNNLQSSTLEEKLQKFIYSGDDRNIVEVYVNGCKIK
ncbi:Guanine deaminase [Eufriesea mexicana]|nr:Guanine deaminase [Eufriesea mexicana]